MSTQTRERLDAYLAAEARILKGQRVQFGDDQLDNPDLDTVRKEITRLQRQLAAERRLAADGSRARVAVVNFSGYDDIGRCGR